MALLAEVKSTSAPDEDGVSCIGLDSGYWGSSAPKTHLMVHATVDGTGITNTIRSSYGWADVNNEVAIGIHSANGASVTDTNRIHTDAYNSWPLSSNGSNYERSAWSSYNSSPPSVCNDWSLDGGTGTSGDAYSYWVLALGGDDLEDVSIDTIDSPTTTGDVGYTGPGFEPSFLIVMYRMATAIPNATTHLWNGFGMSDGTTDASFCMGSRDGLSSDTNPTSALYSEFIHAHNIDTLADYEVGTVKSLDANGYTLNWNTVGGTARKYTIIAVKGPAAKVVKRRQPANDGTADVGTGTVETGVATVKPNADGTGATDWTITNESGGSVTTRFGVINNGVSAANDNEFISNLVDAGSSTESILLGLEDMPSDFYSLDSVTLKIRDKCDDSSPVSCGTRLQIFKSDGTTPLTNQLTKTNKLGDISTSFADKTYTFTITGATDDTTWDGALLKIDHFDDDGEDTTYFVSEVEWVLNYSKSSYVSGTGFVPKAGITIGAMKTGSNFASVNNRVTIGAWDQANGQISSGWLEQDGVSVTNTDRYLSTNSSINNYNHTPTLVGQATVAVQGNGIRETWSNTSSANNAEYEHAWLLLGDNPTGGTAPDLHPEFMLFLE